MQILCKLLLAGLGISAIIIGLMFFLGGAQWTANFFTPLGWLFFGGTEPITGFDRADIDSEFRFYSVFWMAYGFVLIVTAINFEKYFRFVPVLAGLFFLGGVGRIFSYFAYGMPHPLFQLLWILELVLPIIIFAVWAACKHSGETNSSV